MNNTRWNLISGKEVSALTSQEALNKVELNWQVLQSPVQFNNGVDLITDNSHRVNYRSDTRDVLGLVSDTYKVLQNKDAFKFLDSVVGVAEAMYVNVGSFRNGSKVYIQAKLQDKLTFDDTGEDIGEKYLTFVTSHDGSLPISVMFTPIRIVCQNTLLMSLRINEVLERFHSGAGANMKSAKGTAWGAYNAVVEYVDHYRGANAKKRAESSILGSGSMIKEKALSLLSNI